MADPAEAELELVVDEAEAGQRLDVFLVRRIEGLGRSSAKRMIEEGRVRIEGRIRRKGAFLEPGDRITLEGAPPLPDFEPLPFGPDGEYSIGVIYEDEDLLILDKPAGVHSHPLRRDERGTVANFIMSAAPECVAFGSMRREAGLMNRLDTETSGLMIAARSERGAEGMARLFEREAIDKRYRALAMGEVRAPWSIDLPIAHHPGDRRKMIALSGYDASLSQRARPAFSEILSSEIRGEYSYLEIRARSARRHQVRVHLASLGHPLLGDELYEGARLDGLERHFLHASALVFNHPITGKECVFKSPLPAELRRALADLGFS